MDNYIKAMQKGGRKTEIAAKELISPYANSGFIGGGGEKVLEIVPNALTIPSFTFPNGTVRPERYIAFVHLATNKSINPNSEKYNRPRHRILAYWQGADQTFTKEQVLDSMNRPIGGISFVGSYIDVVWIDPEFRGSKAHMPNLYKALREFAKRRGAVSLEPNDDLTSKSFRAAQAKYDWKRANDYQD
jgi:hypothetical protein